MLLCVNRQVEKAVEILGKILRKGLKAPKQCFHHLDLTFILKINSHSTITNQTGKRLGCNADKETYSILIDGLYRKIRYLPIEASQVLQEMLI